MQKQIADVGLFNAKFGLDSLENTSPGTIVTRELCSMRFNFLLEELAEWAQANGMVLEHSKNDGLKFAFVDKEEEMPPCEHEASIDGAVDLLYVLLGTVRFLGYHANHAYLGRTVFEEAWNRVQAANMSKVRSTHSSQSKRGSVYDVVKPEGWQSPKFSDIV